MSEGMASGITRDAKGLQEELQVAAGRRLRPGRLFTSSSIATYAAADFLAGRADLSRAVCRARDAQAEHAREIAGELDAGQCWDAAYQGVGRQQATLLRHIIGNPFRPYPAPPDFPAGIVHRAQLPAALSFRRTLKS